MLRLFFKHSLRYFARHKTLTALNVLGIALGVTVFIAIRIVNYSALESFKASVDIVAGKANLQVVGDGLRFDERVFRDVRAHPEVVAATPVVEEIAALADYPGEYLQIVGVDAFTNDPLRTYQLNPGRPDEGEEFDTEEAFSFSTDPAIIAISEDLAERLGLVTGENAGVLRVQTRDGVREFRPRFVYQPNEDMPGLDEQLAFMDIANAQVNFGHTGRLNRIDVLVREGADVDAVIADLRALPGLPENALVQPPDRRGSQIELMIGAFQLNLTALSLVALLVGMFLIYNTVSAAVVRRRGEIGLLRALGLSRGQVQSLFMGEALLQGLAGLALGLGLGVALAGQLLSTVSESITSLYIRLSIQELLISPSSLLAAAGLTLGAVFLAAWFPSREAARIPPVEALSLGHLRDKARHTTGRWLALAILFLAFCVGFAWISQSGAPAWLSFLSALFCLLGFAFLVPGLSLLAARWLPRPGVVARLAATQFVQSLHRNAVTIAALATALAMVVGISVMIHSFRTTVEAWLYRSVQADLFIAPAENLDIGPTKTLRPEILPLVRETPGVADYNLYRELRSQYDGRPVKVVAVGFPVAAERARLNFRETEGGRAGRDLLVEAAGQDQVVVSEAFARKFGVGAGDTLELPTPGGAVPFAVRGVYQDYSTERGIVLMDTATYQAHWRDQAHNSLAIYAEPGVSAEELRERLRPGVNALGNFLLYSNQQVRREVFNTFDQTFAVTYLLQFIGLLVGGLGIFLSLIILIGERTRELGVLRAAGASRAQLRGIVLWESGLIALTGTVAGMAAGLVLAWLLSNVINVAFFGWTIAWATPWLFLLSLPLWVMLAALASAWWPARVAGRLDIAAAVKME
ncbi:MAG: FtsX-like permease family protein [Verrucomicrobiota bacterium]